MGRILSIRLSATTYKEEDVAKTWPKLCSLAWPGLGTLRPGEWTRTNESAMLGSSVAAVSRAFGVRELVDSLLEQGRFGNWKHETAKSLEALLPKLEKSMDALDTALGDWQPGAANTASDAVEDTLDIMEKNVLLED